MPKDINANSLFVYSDKFDGYKFSDEHPFDPLRIKLTYWLLKSAGCLSAAQVLQPAEATLEEILLAHDKDYVNIVQRGEHPGQAGAFLYGIGTEDTPVFPAMHTSASLAAGATLTGLKFVLSGEGRHAFNPAGGLHHASSGKASGFCIYNDINIAISYLQKYYGYRVLYVDTDAHHGDGVQWHFYDDAAVCTLSIHETGRYLFPGTGTVRERGTDQGYGFTFNVPLDAFTEDDSFKFVFENALLSVADYFKPDIIISQHGADAHFLDPMSDLYLTLDSYHYIPKLIHRIAHEYCHGRWLAVGGGGYNVFNVVPRAWSLVWMEMSGCPDLAQGALPQAWIEMIAAQYGKMVHSTWEDDMRAYSKILRREEIYDKNKKALIDAMYTINHGRIGNDYLSKLAKIKDDIN